MTVQEYERDPELEARLAAALKGCCMGGTIRAFQRVGSTMEIADDLARRGAGEGTLVFAARQDQGRGRLGRTWVSPEGGLYLSALLWPTRPPAEIPQLSLVAGLAVAQAIQEHAKLFPSIRWPNDLLIDDKKVAGILVESKVPGTFPASKSTRHFPKLEKCLTPYVVIGIGINVTTPSEDLPDGAISLVEAMRLPPKPAPVVVRDGPGNAAIRPSRGAPDPLNLTAALCGRFDRWYDVWTAHGFAPIREALRPWMGLFGRPIHISAGTHAFEGTAADLDESGRLLVRLDSGLMRAFEMGEVTLLR